MSNLTFGIHIVASMVAISASYAILMSILKKEYNTKWLHFEAHTALVAAAVSLGLSFQYLTDGDTIFVLSSGLLALGLLVALVLSILQHTKKSPDGYNLTLVSITKTSGIVLFVLFVAHFLLELAALSRITV